MELLYRASALLLQLEVSVELSLKVAQAAAARGVPVILDPSPVRPLPPAFYTCCDVITPNETDAQALVDYPVADRESAALAAGTLLSRGIDTAVVKLGPQGAYYATLEGGEYVPPFVVEAVDSVGAGDAFNGALAVALAEGRSVLQAVRMASAAGRSVGNQGRRPGLHALSARSRCPVKSLQLLTGLSGRFTGKLCNKATSSAPAAVPCWRRVSQREYCARSAPAAAASSFTTPKWRPLPLSKGRARC